LGCVAIGLCFVVPVVLQAKCGVLIRDPENRRDATELSPTAAIVDQTLLLSLNSSARGSMDALPGIGA
jgi:hypothetical protein